MTTSPACQCEHASHWTSSAHPYATHVAPLVARAAEVGWICAACADGHMAAFVTFDARRPGQLEQVTR